MKKEFIEVEIEEGLQINHVAGIDSEGLIVELPYKLAATTMQPWPNHNWCVGCSPDVCSGCGTEPIERREQHAALNASSIQDRQDAYAAGFRRCAEWADRDDLPCDVGSPAYLKDMAADLSVQVKAHLAAAEPVAGEWSVKQANLSSPTMQKDHPDKYSYKPVRLMPADLKIGENDSALPLANLIAAALNAYTAPPQHAAVDIVLFCPRCHAQHIDAPETHREMVEGVHVGNVTLWDNPPHRSHLCAKCGCVWRPADVPTNGVAAVKTTGKADTPLAEQHAARVPDECAATGLSCSYTPHGPNKEMQCEYCGAAPTPPAQES